jgi:hypothetical protein
MRQAWIDARSALCSFYGARFLKLDDDRRAALAVDIDEMVADGDALDVEEAVVELHARIGGQLESYADCVVIDYRRKVQ